MTTAKERKNRSIREDRKYLNTAEAADYLRCSVSTLEKFRSTKVGPPYRRSLEGNAILYLRAELDQWVEQRWEVHA